MCEDNGLASAGPFHSDRKVDCQSNGEGVENVLIRIAIAATCFAFGMPVYGQMQRALPASYSGCYFSTFESSTFSPAGTSDSWWVDWEVDTTILNQFMTQESAPRPRSLHVFMVVRGRVGEEGGYGHLGQYKKRIAVVEIISARKPLPEDQCGSGAVWDDGESLYRLGLARERDGKTAEAVRIYRRAARAGSGKAARRLGEIFDKGLPDVPSDHEESRKYYEMARRLGEKVDLPGKR